MCVLVFSVLSLVNVWWAAACNELHRTWQLKSTLFEIQYNHIHITAPIDTSVLVIPVIVFFHCTSLYLSYIVYTETPVRNILTLCLLEYKKWRIVHDAQWLIQNNVYYVTKLFPQPKRLCIHRCPFVCLFVGLSAIFSSTFSSVSQGMTHEFWWKISIPLRWLLSTSTIWCKPKQKSGSSGFKYVSFAIGLGLGETICSTKVHYSNSWCTPCWCWSLYMCDLYCWVACELY